MKIGVRKINLDWWYSKCDKKNWNKETDNTGTIGDWAYSEFNIGNIIQPANIIIIIIIIIIALA